MTPLSTPRDVLVLRQGGSMLVSAVDSCGGIGPLPQDALWADPQTVGELTARTALLELLCTGAAPLFASVAACNAPEAARPLLEGVRATLGGSLPLIISTEKNLPTCMTALGVTLTGACPAGRLRIGSARPGDTLWCVGLPLVGGEVLQHRAMLPTAEQVGLLLAAPGVHAALPVGSRGVGAEARTLAAESGLTAQLFENPPFDPGRSAGPSSCVVVAADPQARLPELGLPVHAVGRLVQPQE